MTLNSFTVDYSAVATIVALFSSGSSGRVGGGAEKHEIYAAAFGGHLFYDLFLQGQGGGPWPLGPPPGSATVYSVHC